MADKPKIAPRTAKAPRAPKASAGGPKKPVKDAHVVRERGDKPQGPGGYWPGA